MNTVNWLNHLLQSRAPARRSLTRSQQRCLKSAQQEVTLKDQTGNLFVVSHMGEERQVLSSLPVSGNAAGAQSTCLAFPGPSSALLCLSLSHLPNALLLQLQLCVLLTFVSEALAISLSPGCRQAQRSAFKPTERWLWSFGRHHWWSVTAGTLLLIPFNCPWGAEGCWHSAWSSWEAPGLPTGSGRAVSGQGCLLRLPQGLAHGSGTAEPFHFRRQDGGMWIFLLSGVQIPFNCQQLEFRVYTCLYTHAESELETWWGGMVDNSLTKAFKEYPPWGSVCCAESLWLCSLDDGSVDSLGKTWKGSNCEAGYCKNCSI